MQGIGLRKQLHVSGGEFTRKAHRRGAIALGEGLALEAPTHQPAQLRSRVAGDASQIAHQHALVGPAKLAINKASKHRGDETVALGVVAHGQKFNFKSSLQKGAQLRHRVKSCFVHIDHHVVDDQSKPHASGS